MPVGLESLKHSLENDDAPVRTEYDGPRPYVFFNLGPGETANVRFLNVGWAWTNKVLVPGRQYEDYIPSFDQSGYSGMNCPLQQAGLPRTRRGWATMIWRDGPVFARDEEGKIIKEKKKPVVERTEDVLALWTAFSKGALESILHADAKFKGIGSRDMEVSRNKGTGFDVAYHVFPSDIDSGATKLSARDKELADLAPDLNEFVTPQEWNKLAAMVGAAPTGQFGQVNVESEEGNPFFQTR